MKKLFASAATLAALFFFPRLALCQEKTPRLSLAARRSFAAGREIVVAQKKAPPLTANFYGTANYYAPQNFEGDLASDSCWAFSYGFKLGFGALDARFFNSCNKSGGADFWGVESFSDYEAIFKKRRWSVSLDLSKFSGELAGSVAFGSLKFYSQKRDRPFSVVISPFAASLGDAGSIKVSLPTKSSSAQAEAIFAGISFKTVEKFSTDKIRLMPLSAQFGACKNDSDPAKTPFWLGLDVGFFYMNFFKLTAGLAFRRAHFEQRLKADADWNVDWIEEIPVWKSGLLNAASADLALEIPHLKSRTTFSVAENPSSLGRLCFAQELSLAFGAFSISAALFASDNFFANKKSPYAAFNSSEYKKNWQAKISPQLNFKLPNGARLKVGAAALLEERLVDWGKKTEHNSLEARFAAGLQISSKADSFRLLGTSGAAILRQDPAQETVTPVPKASVTVAYSHNFGASAREEKNDAGKAAFGGGRLSFFVGASFQPEFEWEKREWTERAKIAFYPRNSFLSGVWISCQASQKKGACKITPAASVSFLFKYRNFRLNASMTAQAPFEL